MASNVFTAFAAVELGAPPKPRDVGPVYIEIPRKKKKKGGHLGGGHLGGGHIGGGHICVYCGNRALRKEAVDVLIFRGSPRSCTVDSDAGWRGREVHASG